MSSWGPRRLPKIRDQINRVLADENGSFRQQFSTPAERTKAMLTIAELYWVTPDMAALSVAAGASLDEISTTDRPTPAGLLVWEDGIGSIELDDFVYPIDAVSWGPHTGGVEVTVWLRRDKVIPTLASRGLIAPNANLDPLEVPPLIPYAQCVLPTQDQPLENIDVELHTAVRTLAATWLLMDQPTLVETPQVEIDKPIRRAYARQNRRAPSVTLVELRRAYVLNDPNPEPSKRGYHHRWVVSGHWRQQACGPGRTQRRRTWITSHIKGPDGAPILATEKVNVWRR